MTVGEKIQMYRKQLEMSQEELGQKLLVSRQTISLWEHDQTVPTIDNLIRLREIFSVSVDDILGFEAEEKREVEELPRETYRFFYDIEELKRIKRADNVRVYKRPIIFTLIGIIMLLLTIFSSTEGVVISFFATFLLCGMISHIKGIVAYNKAWKKSVNRILNATYEYKIFDDYIVIRKNYGIRNVYEAKYYFSEIEQIQLLDKWLLIQFGGHSYIFRMSDLRENSSIYLYMQRFPAVIVHSPPPNLWKIASIVLFVASLASITGAMLLWGFLSDINSRSNSNMWVFYLMTPIPIASIVFGFILKAKGYKHIMNIIVGIIMTALLCIYGSFSFIFPDTQSASDELIVKAEEMLEIDMPEPKKIQTHDWNQGTQSIPRGHIYSTSYVYFDVFEVEEFEDEILEDDKWIRYISSDMVGIMSPMGTADNYDYKIIYNIDTSEINTLPDSEGTYRFMEIAYRFHDNQMLITEYDVDYVK